MISNDTLVTASTTLSQAEITIRNLEQEFKTTDFGLRIADTNIFYFLYLRDRKSYRKGITIMIGNWEILKWDNCKELEQ